MQATQKETQVTGETQAPQAPARVSGRFGPGMDFVRRKPMDKFARIVAAKVKQRVNRQGHGIKHGVEGALERGSPWFYPDDPLASEIPDRDVHQMTPIFLCAWEFLDRDIKAPPCPFCCSSDHVRVVFRLSVHCRKLFSVSLSVFVSG